MQAKIELDINSNIEIYELNKVAKQASGSVLLKVKNSVVLATIAKEDNQVDEDFLPLTVQYVEKMYAAGRIPGGYIKRETKPGEFETLTSRIIDRSLRPLFPKGYAYPTQITVMVLSADPEVDLQVISLNAASIALYLSGILSTPPVCGVRVARIDNEFKINPTNSELKKSSLDLYLAGIKDELLMIEMRSLPLIEDGLQNMNEFSEDLMVEAIEFGKNAIENASNLYEKTFNEFKKESPILELKPEFEDENIANYIENNYKLEVKKAINQMAKSERGTELKKIVEKIKNDEIAILNAWEEDVISSVLNKYKRKVIREQIINERVRADGRYLDEIRPISIETNILPMAHGSCLFTRGQTQALAISTIGGDSDAQMVEYLTEHQPKLEKFMFNYNFPPFSVGEASMLKAPGRRELGHGNLAKRAIYPSILLNSPQSYRVVSEILESNGSSSMASVCAGSLSLRAAGIKTLKLVAGVAMGLIFENNKYAILTDIMGLEDHDGDMDFKVAGSIDGITALQMDIKLGGISLDILKEALLQAKKGRNFILSLMQEANSKIVVNEENLPKFEVFNIDSSKIPDVIGQGGKNIKDIIEKYQVSIDLDRDNGEVKIQGHKKGDVEGAKNAVLEIIKHSKTFKKGKKSDIKIGEEFEGKVLNILDFGVFVSLRDGIDGLLHISKIDKKVEVGDTLRVRVADFKQNKISLDLIE